MITSYSDKCICDSVQIFKRFNLLIQVSSVTTSVSDHSVDTASFHPLSPPPTQNTNGNKNSAEVDIAPASGKIHITMQGFTLTAITDAEKTKLRLKN